MILTAKAWAEYKAWRDGMEREHGHLIYAPAARRDIARLRYDGPIVKGMKGAPDMWTVVDPASPHYKFTNCRETLLGMGFTEKELMDTKGANQ